MMREYGTAIAIIFFVALAVVSFVVGQWLQNKEDQRA
jgi:ABC-type sugar transport system permease subunit